MAEPTTSRAVLRRAIARKLGMPFARYRDFSALTGSPTTAKLFDSTLSGADGSMEGQWLYMVTGAALGDVRRIKSFQGSDKMFAPDRVLSASPSAADQYEVHSLWNALEVHDAIDQAIDEAFPSFFDVTTDESLVMLENSISYDLSALTTTPWLIRKIWLEKATVSLSGVARASAAAYLTASAGQDLSSVDSAWKVSIYAGTGAGQLRSVSTADNSTKRVTPTAVWTTVPDTTSKYRLWDPTDNPVEWYRLNAARFDNKMWPVLLYLTRRYPSLYGLRMRLQYLNKPLALTLEASTTIVPKQFILDRAMSLLYKSRLGDNRYDQRRFESNTGTLFDISENFRQRNAWRLPDGTLWQDSDPYYVEGSVNDNVGDPLGWSG